MFGWLKSLFGNEPEQERIVPPPLPSKVKKAEKLVSKKIAKKAATKKEVAKKEAPKEETSKKEDIKKTTKTTKPTKEVVQPVVDAEAKSTKKKGGRPKKNTV